MVPAIALADPDLEWEEELYALLRHQQAMLTATACQMTLDGDRDVTKRLMTVTTMT